MKKIQGFVCAIAIVVVAVVAGYNIYTSQNEVNLSDLALENIEALAQTGEDGTNVGYCYIEQTFSDNRGWKKFCDSRTNDGKIYPCPSSESNAGYSESAKDRCTQ